MSKISANELRAGMVIKYSGGLWKIITSSHVRVSGRGGAVMQVEMRNVEDKTKVNQRFRTDEKIERPFVESRKMQFLYAEGDAFVFMDNETYEQTELSKDLLGDFEGYLLPNLEVTIAELDGRAIGIELPVSVDLEVLETEPRIKGATVTSSFKPAKVNTGITVMVPAFVNNGDTIKVSTATGEYQERV